MPSPSRSFASGPMSIASGSISAMRSGTAQLHERDLRVVGALTVEFGVERVGRRGGHVLDDFGECFVGGDPPDRR